MELKEFLKLHEEEQIHYDFSCDGASVDYCQLKDMERFFAYMMVMKRSSFLSTEGKPLIPHGNDACKSFFGLSTKIVADKVGDYMVRDPDSESKLLQEIYKLLWDIPKLPRNIENCIKIQGETLNSANTTLNQLYADIENDYIEEKTRRESMQVYNPKRKEYGSQGISIKFILSKYLVDKDSNIIKNLLGNEELVTFLNCYHTIGNFMPVPTGCNGPRGSSNVKDYWDLTLYHISNYYTNGDSKVLENILGDNPKNIEIYQEWLDSFEGWSDFIEKNYLESFVEKDGYSPKELWEGHFKQNGAYPENREQCQKYFKNASEWIFERGETMVKALNKKEER